MEEKLNQLTFTNAALFGLLIAVAYYFLFYNPSNPKNALEELGRELVTARGEVTKLDRAIKAGQVIKQEIDVMEKAAEKVYGQLAEDTSVQQAAAIVSQEARNVGLSIESMSTDENWVKKKTLALVGVNATIRGSFSQIMVFLSELTRDNKVYSVSEFTITTPDMRVTERDELQFTTKIEAYRKLSSSEIKAEGEEGL
jgi:Tfp pilus assembly protein PilO